MNGPIRVLVVDDQALVREGLRAMLEMKEGIQVIGEAADGNEAVRQALRLEPDVILMDLVMPEKSGIGAIREIIDLRPEARVLVLSGFSEDDKIIDAMRAGAMGYILKSAQSSELVGAIYQVNAGATPLNPLVARRLVKNFTSSRREPPLTELLTDREAEIARLIAGGKTNQEIAKTLNISIRTVGTHTTNILKKAEVENRTQLALKMLRQGVVSLYSDSAAPPDEPAHP